jgi:hypothetical protein
MCLPLQLFDANNNFAGSARVESGWARPAAAVAALWRPQGDDDVVQGAQGGRGAWATAAACRGITHNVDTEW